MVRHIVLYFLKDKSEQNRRKTVETLLSMKGKIPCLKDIEAGTDFLSSHRSCDIALVCTFDSREALNEYAVHPLHLPVKEYMSAVVEKSVSCDYEF